jgi:hypothetical protein
VAGPNPFAQFTLRTGFRRIPLSRIVPVYDWVRDRGYHNIGAWVEAAADARE